MTTKKKQYTTIDNENLENYNKLEEPIYKSDLTNYKKNNLFKFNILLIQHKYILYNRYHSYVSKFLEDRFGFINSEPFFHQTAVQRVKDLKLRASSRRCLDWEKDGG